MTCAADIYLTIKTGEVGHTVEFAEPTVLDVYGVANQSLPRIHLETSSLLGKPQLPISSLTTLATLEAVALLSQLPMVSTGGRRALVF